MKIRIGFVMFGFLSLVLLLEGQNAGKAVVQVPPVIQFSNVATGLNGKPLTGMVAVTFYLYEDQQGGSPLWLETQNVEPDKAGHYSVLLGSTTSHGLPTSIFASGEARWLAVQLQGQEEQPRVLLFSAPYALKAADAETIGGLPPSAFVLASPGVASLSSSSPSSAGGGDSANIGGSGTQNYVPLWTDNSGNLGNSILYQLGTGSTARIGINLTNPLFTLDVKGTELVRGLFEMATINFATSTKGYNSQPFNFESSAYNSGTNAFTLNHFQWQAEPTGNNTTTPGATLNLLYGSDPNQPAETGLKLSSTGVFTFAAAQTFPGAGTITAVNPGTDLTGGGNKGNVTLNLDTTKVPQLKSANTFTGNQTVNGNLTSTGIITASSYQIGTDLFGFGSHANLVAFLGFAGNATSTGEFNTGVGAFALGSNTIGAANTAVGGNALFFNGGGADNTAEGFGSMTYNTEGGDNTASGYKALYTNVSGNFNVADGSTALFSNTTGYDNVAAGYQALYSNSTGCCNTASGELALFANTTGFNNTGVGLGALSNNTTGSSLTCIGAGCNSGADGLSNATAIGAHALVGQSNSLVLGGTGEFAVKVGIGTTTPSNILTIARGSGHPVSDSWETYSSRRWKTNIQTLSIALTKVEQLRGVSYDRKDNGKHEIGVIAEEVGAVVPEVVSWEANGKDASGVDYSRLTALLIEAVKQQQKQIATQQSQIATQQKRAAAQQAEIRGLRSKDALLAGKLAQLQGNVDELRQAKGPVPRVVSNGQVVAKAQF